MVCDIWWVRALAFYLSHPSPTYEGEGRRVCAFKPGLSALVTTSASRSPASTTVQNQNKKSKRLPERIKKERKTVNFKQKPDQFKEAFFLS